MSLRVNIARVFSIAVLLIAFQARAQQITIHFNSAVYGQTLEGLSLVQLVNPYNYDVSGTVVIKVREARAGNVVSINMHNVSIRRGNNMLDRTAFLNSRIVFGNNALGKMLGMSGRFPEGEYEYCFEVDMSDSKVQVSVPFVENCFTQELQPMTPLLLVNPVDGDKECNKRPQFIWQPPMPMAPGSRFRLVLVEIRNKQDVVEAINFNPPIINRGDIPVNQLAFPFNAPELQEGKTYAWQVIMYTDKIVVKKSEIWTYTVKCDEPVQQKIGDSYREMKESVNGDFYVATKVLRFSFTNSYNAGPLNYSIINLTDRKSEINRLPTLVMQTGLNKFDLDLSENKQFKHGQEYLLTVKLTTTRQLQLRFIYKDE